MYFKIPTSIDEMILTESVKKQLNVIEKIKGFHLIYSDSTGSGKSLSAKIIANSISKSALFIDGSCAKSSKYIDDLDRKLSSLDLTGAMPVVVIDEIDKLSNKHLQAISAANNKFANNTDCVVIMTANSTKKIPANLISRIDGINFNNSNNAELVINFISDLVNKESDNAELNDKFMGYIAKIFQGTNGDIRKIFSYTRKFLVTGEIDTAPLLTSGY